MSQEETRMAEVTHSETIEVPEYAHREIRRAAESEFEMAADFLAESLKHRANDVEKRTETLTALWELKNQAMDLPLTKKQPQPALSGAPEYLGKVFLDALRVAAEHVHGMAEQSEPDADEVLAQAKVALWCAASFAQVAA